MKKAEEARAPRAQTGSGHPTHPSGGHGRWRFLRHYLEMVAAMLIGMVVLGAALRDALLALEHLAMLPPSPTKNRWVGCASPGRRP